MKKVLIIGGEGYIGNIISNNLLKEGNEVLSYDNLIFGNNHCVLHKLSNPSYKFIFGDMIDTKKMDQVIQKCDSVILLAGLVGDPITKKYPNESKLINDVGVKNVIDLCSENNIKNFIFVSTCSNYGLINDNEKADEDFTLNPLSLYANSKVKAEKYILSLKGKSGMQPTILRFATAFGLSPRMRFDLTVSEFTREIMLNNELLIYDAHTWRPYCHVQDFSRLIQLVIDSPKEKVAWEVFNAGGDVNNATKKMIADIILKKLPYGKIKYQEHGSDPRNYRVNFEKVKSILGFEPIYSIEEGVDELIDAMQSQLFAEVESNKNFYGNYEINYKIK